MLNDFVLILGAMTAAVIALMIAYRVIYQVRESPVALCEPFQDRFGNWHQSHTFEYTGEAWLTPKARRCTRCAYVEERNVEADGTLRAKVEEGWLGEEIRVIGEFGAPVGVPFDWDRA